MKNERLLRALGDVDHEWIAAAAPNGKTSKRLSIKWMAVAASLLAVAAIGLGLWRGGVFARSPDRVVVDKVYPEKIVDRPQTDGEIAIVPKWEDMTVSQQFAELPYNGVRYSTQATAIAAESVGAQLASATLTGEDIYTDAVYSTNGEVFEIVGISSDCAVALRFEDRSDYFVYVNHHYKPNTLGDLIRDLKLDERLELGAVRYDWRVGANSYLIEFPDVEDRVIWERLLSDTALENVYDDQAMYRSLMSVSVDIPLLGYENIGLWVTEDGYLVTNILGSGKAFLIGEEKVNAFVGYVTENCQGYEIVYRDSQKIPE